MNSHRNTFANAVTATALVCAAAVVGRAIWNTPETATSTSEATTLEAQTVAFSESAPADPTSEATEKPRVRRTGQLSTATLRLMEASQRLAAEQQAATEQVDVVVPSSNTEQVENPEQPETAQQSEWAETKVEVTLDTHGSDGLTGEQDDTELKGDTKDDVDFADNDEAVVRNETQPATSDDNQSDDDIQSTIGSSVQEAVDVQAENAVEMKNAANPNPNDAQNEIAADAPGQVGVDEMAQPAEKKATANDELRIENLKDNQRAALVYVENKWHTIAVGGKLVLPGAQARMISLVRAERYSTTPVSYQAGEYQLRFENNEWKLIAAR
ncbi:MAG: hypothetical protein AAF958_02860 [Planctomycetota bacterium]